MTNEQDKLVKHLQGFYPVVQVKADGNVCALAQMAFTWAILSECCYAGYADRWCYADPLKAIVAFATWNGEDGTEPEGWHRHPGSGRRRPDGDPEREYVDP